MKGTEYWWEKEGDNGVSSQEKGGTPPDIKDKLAPLMEGTKKKTGGGLGVYGKENWVVEGWKTNLRSPLGEESRIQYYEKGEKGGVNLYGSSALFQGKKGRGSKLVTKQWVLGFANPPLVDDEKSRNLERASGFKKCYIAPDKHFA